MEIWNISPIQQYDCLVEAEIGQQGGSGANRMQELEQTIVRQCIYNIYICIYVKIHCS